MDVKRVTQLASGFGLIYLVLWVPAVLMIFVEGNPALALCSLALGIVTNVCYAILLFGLLKIAKERGEMSFIRNVKIALYLVFAAICASPFDVLLPKTDGSSTSLLLTALSVVIAFAIGIISILLADNFRSLQDEYGEYAKKAALYNKISGWLTVSVILFPIGYLLSIVGDYYIWQMVRERSRK